MPRVPRKDGTDRRPRSDSALMSLPDDRQRELFDFCDGLRSEGLRTIRERLGAEKGVTVSLGTLSNWLNWYSLRAKVQGVAAMADDLARILKETPGLDLDDAKIMRTAQAFFEARAMQENDAETYVKLAGVRRGTAEIQIKQRRLSLEEKKLRQAEAAKDVTKDTTLTPEEKEMRYREIFGLGANK
jgi:hypothetical protein